MLTHSFIHTHRKKDGETERERELKTAQTLGSNSS